MESYIIVYRNNIPIQSDIDSINFQVTFDSRIFLYLFDGQHQHTYYKRWFEPLLKLNEEFDLYFGYPCWNL